MTDIKHTTTPAPSENEELGRLFRHTTRMLARAYHRRDRAHHAQDHVITLLHHRGPLRQKELLRILDVRSSSLSEVLSKLEKNGLIARERDEEDRRSFVISVTAQGAALARGPEQESGSDGADHSADRLFGCLDDTERQQLRDILTKLAENLRADPEFSEGRGRGKGRGQGRGRGMRGGKGRGGRGEGGQGRGGRGQDGGGGNGKGRG